MKALGKPSACRGAIIAAFLLLCGTNSHAAEPISSTEETLRQNSEGTLQIEDVFSMLNLKDTGLQMTLSRDGRMVAYTVEDRRKKERESEVRWFTKSGVFKDMVGCDIWVTDTVSGVTMSITEGQGNSWSPAWSPDGRLLAFNSDRSGSTHLWIWDRSTNGLRQISDAVTRLVGFDSLKWTPDGREILTRVLPEGTPVSFQPSASRADTPTKTNNFTLTKPAVRVFESWAAVDRTGPSVTSPTPQESEWTRASRADLALVNVTNGTVKRIAKGVLSTWADVSPDGSRVAFANRKPVSGIQKSFRPYFDIVVVDLSDGSIRTVIADVPLNAGGQTVAWSPNGELLSYSTSEDDPSSLCGIVSASERGIKHKASGNTATAQFGYQAPLWDDKSAFLYALGGGSLWRIKADDGSATLVATIPGKPIGSILAQQNRRQPWSKGGDFVVVIAQDTHTTKSGFFKIDLKTGTMSTLREDEQQYGGFGGVLSSMKTSVSDDEQLIVFAAESADQSEELWVIQSDFRRARQLTHINPNIGRIQMGKQQLLEWKGRDGEAHQGLLLLPSDFRKGTRYPLVVHVYEQSQRHANTFGLAGTQFFNLQLFATRGYAVLFPDAPVFRKPDPMQRIADIVLPGIERVIELGIADANRVGVMGHSSGGYMALSLLVQYPFKAGLVSAGIGDMFSFYGIPLNDDGSSFGMPWAEDQMGMKASPWEVQERYLRNSPWFFLDKVVASVLLLVGTQDAPNVAQMDQVFVGLKRLGKRAQYAKYEGEAHAEEWWSAANKLDAARRMLGWFDKHLKNGRQSQGPTIPH